MKTLFIIAATAILLSPESSGAQSAPDSAVYTTAIRAVAQQLPKPIRLAPPAASGTAKSGAVSQVSPQMTEKIMRGSGIDTLRFPDGVLLCRAAARGVAAARTPHCPWAGVGSLIWLGKVSHTGPELAEVLIGAATPTENRGPFLVKLDHKGGAWSVESVTRVLTSK